MRSVISLGPVSIRISRHGIAKWGYPTIRIGGFEMFSRSSNGSMIIASYHPRKSMTWLWSVSVGKRNGTRMVSIAPNDTRRGQWHHFFNVGSAGLCISRQRFMARRQ